MTAPWTLLAWALLALLLIWVVVVIVVGALILRERRRHARDFEARMRAYDEAQTERVRRGGRLGL